MDVETFFGNFVQQTVYEMEKKRYGGGRYLSRMLALFNLKCGNADSVNPFLVLQNALTSVTRLPLSLPSDFRDVPDEAFEISRKIILLDLDNPVSRQILDYLNSQNPKDSKEFWFMYRELKGDLHGADILFSMLLHLVWFIS